MKYLILLCSAYIVSRSYSTYAQANDFLIIPESEKPSEIGTIVNDIGSQWGGVIDRYNAQAEKNKDIGTAFATGVFTRDTILDYLVYLIRFLSQIGILIGWVMIIYAGYIYATAVFNDNNISKAKDAISKAILWIIIITSSYAIVRIVTRAFLL